MTKTSKTILTRDQNISAATKTCQEDILFSTDSNFEEIEMTFATDGIDFILDLLTDLSVNRGAYALREAYSNAYDATMQTGDMSRPIEITLPHIIDTKQDTIVSALFDINKSFDYAVIKDYGCGMTEEDVKLYFTQYGGSKKRSGDCVDTIGSKGLGSKAPLAVSDTFTVRTTKDGITTTALIERRGSRNFASITSEETQEENGTEVRIPVSDVSVAEQMIECAKQIADNNLDANLYIDGKKTTSILSTEKSELYTFIGNVKMGCDADGNDVCFRVWQLSDSFPVLEFKNSSCGIALNLAGVQYALEKSTRYDGAYEYIIAGDPGYLNFTPSRDEIKMDKARENFIKAIKEGLENYDYSDSVNRFISSKFNTAAERMVWLRSKFEGHKRLDNEHVELEVRYKERISVEPIIVEDNKNFYIAGDSILRLLENDDEKFYVIRHQDKRFMCHYNYGSSMPLADVCYLPKNNSSKITKKEIVQKCSLFTTEEENSYSKSYHVGDCMNTLLTRFAAEKAKGGNFRVVLLNGFDNIEKIAKFVSNETALYCAKEDCSTNYYVISTENSFGEHEKELMLGFCDDVEVYSYEEMLEVGRLYRKAQRNSSKFDNEEKSDKTRMRNLPSSAHIRFVDLDEVIADNFKDVKAEVKTCDLNDDTVFDNSALVFGDSDLYTTGLTAALLRKSGDMDSNIRKIAFVSTSIPANDIRYLVTKCGKTVLVDAREKISKRFEGIFTKCDKVVFDSYFGRYLPSAELMSAGWESFDTQDKNELIVSYAYKIANTRNLASGVRKRYDATSDFALFEAFHGVDIKDMFSDEDIRFAFDFFKNQSLRYDDEFCRSIRIQICEGQDAPDAIADDVEKLVRASAKTYKVMNECELFERHSRKYKSDMFRQVILPGLVDTIEKSIKEGEIVDEVENDNKMEKAA